jgi:Ca-activated chloride channel homolog
MRTPDIQPDRLTRSVQKIHDLLNLRPGAKTSLIAYSGTAHVVMPVTKDENIVNNFAGALDPKIMPSEGDSAAEALRLADQTLAGSGSGSIVWIADNIAPEESSSLARWRKSSRTPLHLLMPLSRSGNGCVEGSRKGGWRESGEAYRR